MAGARSPKRDEDWKSKEWVLHQLRSVNSSSHTALVAIILRWPRKHPLGRNWQRICQRAQRMLPVRRDTVDEELEMGGRGEDR